MKTRLKAIRIVEPSKFVTKADEPLWYSKACSVALPTALNQPTWLVLDHVRTLRRTEAEADAPAAYQADSLEAFLAAEVALPVQVVLIESQVAIGHVLQPKSDVSRVQVQHEVALVKDHSLADHQLWY